MEFLIIGIVSALNLILIVHKFKKGRVEDGLFDSILFAVLATLFSGSYGGMVVAMISSLVISIYLWTSPPTFFRNFMASDDVKQFMDEIKTAGKPKKKSSKKSFDLKDIDFD